MHSEFGVSADWPLDYTDLLPFYEQIERFLGVSGPAHYPWDDTRSYPLPPVALNAPAQAMQRGAAAIGLTTAPAPIAAVSRDYTGPSGAAGILDQASYPLRHACVNRGYCHQGCRNGAKASMDVTYLPVAVARGAEIRPETFVHGFEQDSSTGRITAVVYRDKAGLDHRQRTRAVFLCAGGVETPRLLLHTGLANASGQVGRNFMAHVATQVWGTFDEEMRSQQGLSRLSHHRGPASAPTTPTSPAATSSSPSASSPSPGPPRSRAAASSGANPWSTIYTSTTSSPASG